MKTKALFRPQSSTVNSVSYPPPWDQFRGFLKKRKIVHENRLDFYVNWARQFYRFSEIAPYQAATEEKCDIYLRSLSKIKEAWQIDQAKEAIGLYTHFLNSIKRPSETDHTALDTSEALWKEAGNDMRKMIRLKQLALTTERTYIGWLRGFYRYVRPKIPENLSGDDIKSFLTHLAVDRKVAASSQNQAFNALLFFYRHVFGSGNRGPWKRRPFQKKDSASYCT